MHSEPNQPRIQKSILTILILVLLLSAIVSASLPAVHAQGEATVGTNFNSTFNTNHSGWTPVHGTWSLVSSAYYSSPGISNFLSSIQHGGTYNHLVYSVRMKRTGSLTGEANGILVRGNSAGIGSVGQWKSGYWFQYTNSGNKAVVKLANGMGTFLKPWTTSSSINKGGWNTLKVIAIGSSLKYYINGILAWSGNDSQLSSGIVGVQFWRPSGSTGNKLYVDWATLSTTATSDPVPSSSIATGIEVPGGAYFQSP